jgi:hypothetical protein
VLTRGRVQERKVTSGCGAAWPAQIVRGAQSREEDGGQRTLDEGTPALSASVLAGRSGGSRRPARAGGEAGAGREGAGGAASAGGLGGDRAMGRGGRWGTTGREEVGLRCRFVGKTLRTSEDRARSAHPTATKRVLRRTRGIQALFSN